MMVERRVKAKKKSFWCKCVTGTFVYIFIVFLLLFLVCFVIIPVVFKYSPGFQRSLIFPTWLINETQNYSDFDYFGLNGVKNFHLKVNPGKNISLGIWEILPEYILSDYIPNDMYNYEGLLSEKRISILIFLHGNGHDRTGGVNLYLKLRKYFLIIACDYRGYGDSSKALMTKDGMANDISSVYKWLRSRTESQIFIWGHSLGTGIGTEVISKLKEQNQIPSGLILEAPFTSVIDVMERHPIVKLYSWLPWYKTTLIDPMIDNGLNLNPARYIVDVNCPIMILHAKDDSIIPYDMGVRLYEIAIADRNTTSQGKAFLHLFDETLRYDHMYIYMDPKLPQYIVEFIEESVRVERSRNTTKKN